MLSFFISISVVTAWLDNVVRDLYGVESGVTLQGQDMSGFLREEARDIIVELAMKEQLLPQEPRLDKSSGQIIPERDGIVIDINSTLYNVMHAQPGESVELVSRKVHSKYKRSDLEVLTENIGSYHTYIYGSYQRSTNITLATAALDNTIIWPGQEFSFNEVVGPRTPERGYMPAPVILMGGNNMDYGGGVCQVSSTVYNAALEAGLLVVERHPHSRPVRYVPPNRDATVTFGYLDLRIKNHHDKPVIIKSGVSQGKVWVSILGEGRKQ